VGTWDQLQKPSSSPSTGGGAGVWVGSVLGTLALIGACVGAFFLYRYVARSRRLKGKYNPAREEQQSQGGPPMPMANLTTGGERLI